MRSLQKLTFPFTLSGPLASVEVKLAVKSCGEVDHTNVELIIVISQNHIFLYKTAVDTEKVYLGEDPFWLLLPSMFLNKQNTRGDSFSVLFFSIVAYICV